MRKFATAKLVDGNLEVDGPVEAEAGWEVKHVRFMVSQGEVMVEDEGHVAGDGWSGSTAGGGLQPGDAQAVGLAIMLDRASPPGFETVTWIEPVRIT
jgi:hypothetical protein